MTSCWIWSSIVHSTTEGLDVLKTNLRGLFLTFKDEDFANFMKSEQRLLEIFVKTVFFTD